MEAPPESGVPPDFPTQLPFPGRRARLCRPTAGVGVLDRGGPIPRTHTILAGG
jgi:hypothetical protein